MDTVYLKNEPGRKLRRGISEGGQLLSDNDTIKGNGGLQRYDSLDNAWAELEHQFGRGKLERASNGKFCEIR